MFARLSSLLSCLIVWFATGCGSPQTPEGPPPRPAELDRLGDLIGKWEGTTQMAGPEPMTSTFVNKAEWACDKRIMIERMQMQTDMGPMEMVGVWAWNPSRQRFAVTWYDSAGSIIKGEGWYDEDEELWHFYGSGKNMMTGSNNYGEGTSLKEDANKYTFSWKEWSNSMKLGAPIMEMSGTSFRK